VAWHEQRYWLTRLADETPEPILNEVAESGGPMTTPSLSASDPESNDLNRACQPTSELSPAPRAM